jgi:signal transduction histidine kinase
MRWRHPVASYLLAALVQVLVAVITRLLIAFAPTFAFPGVVEILAVALIAMTWGAGPAVFAALLGLGLEEAWVLPLRSGEGRFTSADLLEGVVFMAVGIGISVVASTTERSRRHAIEQQAEAEARAAQAREAALHQTQARMDEWLAIASHDLRAPVAALMGFNHLATRRYERLSATVVATRPDLADQVAAVHACLSDASQSGERLHRLVGMLFDTTQVRADKLHLLRTSSDLRAVVREQVEALRVMNPDRTLLLEVAWPAPEHLEIDADRIGQVVNNYAMNALKYSPADQPVAVRIAGQGSWACVSVEDHGPGLPASEQERIWTRFYQAAGVGVQSGSSAGLGLGLHISKAIIEGHGGHVGVKSEIGTGSTFWFTLPITARNARTMA